jgi:tyrosine aminotransferase
MASETKGWSLNISEHADRTTNPIREAMRNIVVKPDHPNKINLGIGDPSIFDEFRPPQCVVDIVCSKISSFKGNGYIPSIGTDEAR